MRNSVLVSEDHYKSQNLAQCLCSYSKYINSLLGRKCLSHYFNVLLRKRALTYFSLP